MEQFLSYCLKLITHLHLVPGLRMRGAYLNFIIRLQEMVLRRRYSFIVFDMKLIFCYRVRNTLISNVYSSEFHLVLENLDF
jgi:hypothetical protein